MLVGQTDAGPNPQNFGVARLTANGEADTGFAGDGKETYDFSSLFEFGSAAAEDASGRILVVGTSEEKITVFRIGG